MNRCTVNSPNVTPNNPLLLTNSFVFAQRGQYVDSFLVLLENQIPCFRNFSRNIFIFRFCILETELFDSPIFEDFVSSLLPVDAGICEPVPNQRRALNTVNKVRGKLLSGTSGRTGMC
jgi:hypothetical protein